MKDDNDMTQPLPQTPDAMPPHFPVRSRKKSTLRRPLFWIVFVAILLFLLPGVVALTTPANTVAANPELRQQMEKEGSGEISTPDASKPSWNEGADSPQEKKFDSAAGRFDWNALEGLSLTNAFSMMDNGDVPASDLRVTFITDNGRQVVNPSNWTVTKADYQGDSRLVLSVKHNDGTSLTDSSTQEALKEKGKQVYKSAKNGLSNLSSSINEWMNDK